MENKEFRKDDLVAGRHAVKLADGKLFLVMDGFLLSSCCSTWLNLKDYDDKLMCRGGGLELDIAEVYNHIPSGGLNFIAFNSDYLKLLWKREEVVEMTLAEVCAALGKKIKIKESHE